VVKGEKRIQRIPLPYPPSSCIRKQHPGSPRMLSIAEELLMSSRMFLWKANFEGLDNLVKRQTASKSWRAIEGYLL
jgi:hypothetical protein